MSKPQRYRPYYQDYCAHCIRHYLSRENTPDAVPTSELTECSRQDLAAVEKALTEMTPRQKTILNECYSPLTDISMFNLQFVGACEKLGIDGDAAWAELSEALYRVAWHRGLIGKPKVKYRHLYKENGDAV